MKENISRKTVFGGLGWKLGERILARGIEFLISLVLARILSPDDYGIIAMVLVFITIADVFVTSGFATALIQKKDANSLDFSTMFWCSLICSLIIYGIIFVSAPAIASFYHQPILINVLRVFALKIPFSVYNSIQQSYVSRHMLFKKLFLSTFTGTLVSGGIGIVLALWGAGVWALIAQYITNVFIVTFVLMIKIPWYPKLEFSMSAAKSLMSYGWKVLAADLSGTFFGQLRSLIIGKFFTTKDLAYYNKGQQFPNLIYTNLATTVMAVLFPTIANFSDDFQETKKITRRAMKMIVYIIFPLMFGLAAVAPLFVEFLLTDKWIECVPFLQIMCVDYAIAATGIAPFQTLKAMGRSDIILKLEVYKKPIYLLLLLIGVRHSVLAVAVTMVLYELYGVIVNLIYIKKYLHYRIKEQIEDIYVSIFLSFSMAVLVWFINIPSLHIIWNLIIKVCIGSTYYIILSHLLKFEPYMYLRNLINDVIKRKS